MGARVDRKRAEMGGVRPFVEGDIGRVAELHDQVFPPADPSTATRVPAYLREVFCGHPWRDDALPSLVYEVDGRVVGCLGVMPRPMRLNGRRIVAAVSHNFMVERDRRSPRVALELLKAYVSGPQDLCLAEGNNLSRKLWEALGGTTSLLYSLRWTRPLRPAACALSSLRHRGSAGALGHLLRPLGAMVDAMAARLSATPFRQTRPCVSGEALTEQGLLALISALSGGRSLRPEYEEPSLAWLLRVLAAKSHLGTFQKVAVRAPEGGLVGWYLYYLNPGGVSEIVQLAARRQAAGDVLLHLFSEAWRQESIAVSGQLDPTWGEALLDKYCLLHNGGGSWMLVHAKRPELLDVIHRGDAFLTRLEGEWWIASP